MTEQQREYLTIFAKHGGYLEPSGDEGKRVCRELCAMKLLRPQPVLDTASLTNKNAVFPRVTNADMYYLFSVFSDEVCRSLEARGYDLRTLRFTIDKKEVPHAPR